MGGFSINGLKTGGSLYQPKLPAPQPVGTPPAGPKGNMPPGIGGLTGSMGMLGVGSDPIAYKVESGDSLDAIARKQISSRSLTIGGAMGSSTSTTSKLSPRQEARVQELVQQIKRLNQLDSNGSIQAGQIILLPSPFARMGPPGGQATSELSFLDNVDAPRVIEAQQRSAQQLTDALKAVNLPQRIAFYTKCPPPQPAPEDMEWMFKLKAAEMNNLLHYKPSAQEQQLATILQESMAWQQLTHQPTRISRADLLQLPASVQATLRQWMASDGKVDDFSSIDLAKASPDAVKQLLATLKAQGNPPQAQRLTQMLTQLSREENLGMLMVGSFSFNRGGTQQQEYMTFTWAMNQLPKADQERYQANLKAIAATLSDPELVQRGAWNLNVEGNRLAVFQPSTNTLRDFDLTECSRQADTARTTLRTQFRFEPANPYDFNAVKAMKDTLKTNQEKIEFIQNYMVAHFQHPGGDTKWLRMSHLSERLGISKDIFFGNPPALDRLPDGRCLIDCEGFTKLSQILLATVIPESKALPVVTPGHILNLVKIGDSMYAFNNQYVQPIEFSADEKKKFESLHSDYDSAWDDMNPFQQSPWMKAADYPHLYEYIQKFSMPSDAKLAAMYKGDYIQAYNRDKVFQ